MRKVKRERNSKWKEKWRPVAKGGAETKDTKARAREIERERGKKGGDKERRRTKEREERG